ncbi:hypothetical protein FNV43_RR26991 [Rhamnella rubrinervis]|uniref:Uncharacterized protein n=1 Tax=Rhamnella rubrinervis TaxID=2594499 RepID=A0A8K0GK65_9ROSA|nr:hypothetical protein FNV43_RR26991 [Rhamnella rubrinervis]
MLKNSTPDELNINLIKILSCLAKTPKSKATLVSLVKEIETSFTIIELINNPHEELAVATIKLLIMLAPHMGHTLADRLCKTRGQPESLVQAPNEMTRITEKQALIKEKKIPVCPVHRGACSSENTFCLVDAKAVERLLACLDHENPAVVEAALSALCTLLDDKVDVDKSVSMLNGVNAVQHVLNVVKEHRHEGLWQKSFWVIEKFLMKGGDQSASDITRDRLLPATLVSAFHHGDGNTRQMAEKVLTRLNKMPGFNTTTSYTMSM